MTPRHPVWAAVPIVIGVLLSIVGLITAIVSVAGLLAVPVRLITAIGSVAGLLAAPDIWGGAFAGLVLVGIAILAVANVLLIIGVRLGRRT